MFGGSPPSAKKILTDSAAVINLPSVLTSLLKISLAADCVARATTEATLSHCIDFHSGTVLLL